MLPRRRIHTLILLVTLVFAVAMLGYISNGFYTRFMVDDYCYEARYADTGFWQTQWDSYFKLAEYSGNRYSLTFMYGLNYLFGRGTIGYFPPAVIVFFLAAAAFLIWNVMQLFNLRLNWAEALLGGEALLFFTFYQAVNLYQALYWFSSMMTYTAPLAFLTLLLGLIVWQARRGAENWLFLALLGLLAFFAGGFSETNAALQAGALGLALAAAWWARRRGSVLAGRFLPLLAAALVGTLFALAALVLSPTNAPRQAAYREPPNLVNLVLISLRFAFDFSWESLKGGPIPISVSIGLFALLSLVVHDRYPEARSGKYLLPGLGLALLATYLLVVCCAAPTVYARTAYPEGRTWTTGRYVMVAGAAAVGWLLGGGLQGLAARAGARKVELALTLAALGLCIYGMRATQTIYTLSVGLQKRAAAWDARDLQIRQARDAGQRDLVVPAIDSISQVIELQDDPGYWVNGCASHFYGVDSISAVE